MPDILCTEFRSRPPEYHVCIATILLYTDDENLPLDDETAKVDTVVKHGISLSRYNASDHFKFS
jgi:hypothetical protein